MIPFAEFGNTARCYAVSTEPQRLVVARCHRTSFPKDLVLLVKAVVVASVHGVAKVFRADNCCTARLSPTWSLV